MRTHLLPISILVIYLVCCAATCSVTLDTKSIRPELNTFYVKQFSNNASSAPPDLANDFSERLRDKIRQETRLSYANTDPDIEFEGAMTGFTVTSVAPQPGELTQFSRLTIRIKVEYIDNKDEEKNWEQTFPFFVDYPADQNLLDIQDQLVDEIFTQILEDIFNKAFGDW